MNLLINTAKEGKIILALADQDKIIKKFEKQVSYSQSEELLSYLELILKFYLTFVSLHMLFLRIKLKIWGIQINCLTLQTCYK